MASEVELRICHLGLHASIQISVTSVLKQLDQRLLMILKLDSWALEICLGKFFVSTMVNPLINP